MENGKVIIRNQPADHVTYSVTSTLMDSIKAPDMLEWHRVDLNRMYISANDKIEADILVTRGWDTNMEINVDSNPEESVDRLTDYMINDVKQTIRSLCEEELGVEFAEGEKIRSVRINTEVGRYTDTGDDKYVVEFDTEEFQSDVVTDHKMSGNPRIAGRRLLVSWIWNKHARNDMSEEELVAEFNSTVTRDEVRSAVEFAENSDEFDSRDQIDSEESGEPSEFATLDEIEDVLSDEEELMDVEDNR